MAVNGAWQHHPFRLGKGWRSFDAVSGRLEAAYPDDGVNVVQDLAFTFNVRAWSHFSKAGYQRHGRQDG